ncbi:predicted protein [Chaetoceros tenuissimus]|uniref:Uncharacterized protein n=1 Tax=Chaetoceros tenuissimus TaxID=426638 RepID=A0AAD3H4J5_9STRA|nr:predicted protein [Chaetoceros tenuissimus]
MSASKPWLISSSSDLANDARESDKYKAQYKSTHQFPGVEASIETKMKWVQAIETKYEDIMDDSFYQASAPDPISYCKDVLLEHCPEEVRVDFWADYAKLKTAAKDMTPDNETKLLERVASYFPDMKGKTSLEKIENCLGKKEEVMIASKTIGKKDNIIDELNKVLKQLGLEDYVQGGRGSSEESDHWSWGLDPILGRNMYSKDNDSGFFWRMNLEFHKKAEMTAEEKAVADYQIELKKKKAESGSTDTPKVFVLMKRNSEGNDEEQDDDDDYDSEDEEETPVTSENFQPMWLPKVYNNHYDRIAGHFFEGEGETIAIKQRLNKGNTDTGNLRIMIFYKQLKYAKNLTSYNEKLAAIFALTQIGAYDNYWMHDNENPDDVREVVEELASVWKNDLLKEDNETLGLGLAGENGDDSPNASRNLLHEHLKLLRKQYECEEDITFNWEPASEKKRKRS